MDEETRNVIESIDEELRVIDEWSESVWECIKSLENRIAKLENKMGLK